MSHPFKNLVLIASLLLTAWAQDKPNQLTEGQQLLQAARQAGTAEAYAAAEAAFDRIIQQDAKNALALAWRGMARLEHSGWYARQGKFAEATPLGNRAYADLDQAVSLAPDEYQIRSLRGGSYAYLPALLGKSELARADLEFVTQHAQFAAQPVATRIRMQLLLGRLYAEAGQSEKALQSLRAAVKLNPDSADGKAAQAELAKLIAPVMATDEAGNRRPDRMPNISADAGPIMVAATITIPDHQGKYDDAHLPTSMRGFLAQVKAQPGCLGLHRLESIEHPGMFVMLTWWKDKVALNNFFYSETHQGMIRQQYQRGNNPPTGQPNAGQVGIEIFAVLPGGRQFNGGLTPMHNEGKR